MSKNKIYNAGIYLRLSRDDNEKNTESNSITNQRNLLLEYLKTKGFNYYAEYIDDGISGTTFERPGFKKMLEDVENGNINMIVTKDLSRFARNIMTSYYLDEYFPLHGIRFIAILDNYDSIIDDSNKELAWVKNGMNENYCRETSKKVRNGLYQAKSRGLFTGWKAPYGYKKDKNNHHKLIIDDNVSYIIKRIFDLAYNGKSSNQIADILNNDKIPNPSTYAGLDRKKESSAYNLWCPRTISEILTNQTYIGNLTQGRRKRISYKIKKEIRTPKESWIIVENTHEGIIDKEKFNTIQNLLKKNRTNKNNIEKKLLQGFIFCKECKHAITISTSTDKKRNYCCCSYYRKYSKYHVCTPHTINYQKLESIVLEEIRKLFKSKININRLELKLKTKIKENNMQEDIHLKIKELNNKKKKIEDALDIIYIDKITNKININRYKTILKKLNDELTSLESQIKLLEIELIKMTDKNTTNINYLNIINNCLELKIPDRRLLANIIDKIYLNEQKEIEIIYKIRIL